MLFAIIRYVILRLLYEYLSTIPVQAKHALFINATQRLKQFQYVICQIDSRMIHYFWKGFRDGVANMSVFFKYYFSIIITTVSELKQHSQLSIKIPSLSL